MVFEILNKIVNFENVEKFCFSKLCVLQMIQISNFYEFFPLHHHRGIILGRLKKTYNSILFPSILYWKNREYFEKLS